MSRPRGDCDACGEPLPTDCPRNALRIRVDGATRSMCHGCRRAIQHPSGNMDPRNPAKPREREWTPDTVDTAYLEPETGKQGTVNLHALVATLATVLEVDATPTYDQIRPVNQDAVTGNPVEGFTRDTHRELCLALATDLATDLFEETGSPNVHETRNKLRGLVHR